MTNTDPLTSLKIVRLKDIISILDVSKNTASKYYKEIKEEYSIEIVTMQHLCHYLKIPNISQNNNNNSQ